MVTSFKYLGIHVFKNGSLHRTQKKDYRNVLPSLYIICSLSFDSLNLTTQKCKLFDVLVGSVLNYSAEVWENNEAKDIEIIHTKFCRWVLNVQKSTNLSGLYGELGRYPLIKHLQKNKYDSIFDKDFII